MSRAGEAMAAFMTLCVSVYLALIIVGTLTDPEYQQGYTARYNAVEQRRIVEVQQREQSRREWMAQAGDTARTWGMWGAGAGVAVFAAWQVSKTWRHHQEQRTERHALTVKRDIARAWLSAYYPDHARLPPEQRPYIGTMAGMRGVFLPGQSEFLPEDVCAVELRRLTVDA